MIKELKKEIFDIASKYDIELPKEDFIERFQNKVNWWRISVYQKLSEDFIERFQNEVDWHYISEYQKLSEEFIEKFQDRVDWLWISKYQKLSEDFIEKFRNEVNWCWISEYQKLSEDFIERFQDRVDWDYVSKYQKLSEDFIEKHNLVIDFDNWLYLSKKRKSEEIEKYGLYEKIGDKIIAYKGIRSDNCSNFNFQYQYFVGKTYESHCDCTDDENSFGLSVWTLEKAKEYCGEKIIKVEINIEDLGRIVHDGGKLRCFKFKVLEEIRR